MRHTSSWLLGKDGEMSAIFGQRRWDMKRPRPSTTNHSLSISKPRSPSVACWTSCPAQDLTGYTWSEETVAFPRAVVVKRQRRVTKWDKVTGAKQIGWRRLTVYIQYLWSVKVY